MRDRPGNFRLAVLRDSGLPRRGQDIVVAVGRGGADAELIALALL